MTHPFEALEEATELLSDLWAVVLSGDQGPLKSYPASDGRKNTPQYTEGIKDMTRV